MGEIVDLKDLLQLLHGGHLQETTGGNTCIIDQDIYLSSLFQNRLQGLLDGILVGHVEIKDLSIQSILAFEVVDKCRKLLVLLADTTDKVITLLCKETHSLLADATVTSRNQNSLSFHTVRTLHHTSSESPCLSRRRRSQRCRRSPS